VTYLGTKATGVSAPFLFSLGASLATYVGGAVIGGYRVVEADRVLTTNIDLDEGTCSLDLLEAASGFFALTRPQARSIIKEVAIATATWRNVANAAGARAAEIDRMASAFEHDDLVRALVL